MGTRRQISRWSCAAAAILTLAASLAITGLAAPAAQAAPPFIARGSVNQVYTYGHPAGAALSLLDAASSPVSTATADAQGAFIFKDVPKATGYQVVEGATTVSGLDVSGPADNPPFSFYQGINLGSPPPGQKRMYTYIPTRDGTLLSATINFPLDGSTGPWPVVIDYSGYAPSQPPGPPQEAQMFPYMGYVTVGLNLRGTTCSGGAFDLWETLQTLDGYDAIETLAAQSWSNGNVGMVGISYMGISQLFVAQTNPPHLNAITPLSVYDNFYRGIGYPGGIINKGFFLEWLRERDNDSNPASHTWVKNRIANGDTVCAENQILRLQSRKLIPEATAGRFYETRGDYLSPQSFVGKIKVPTFLAGAYNDEQTGGHWSSMVNRFDPNTKLKIQLTNGTHVEGLGPEHLARMLEFVDFYVGKRVPSIPGLVRFGATLLYADLFGTPNAGPDVDRFTGQPYATALATYEAEPKVRVYWENGAGRNPGEPFSTYKGDYASWPLPGVIPASYYLQPDGALGANPPSLADTEARGASSYAYDYNSKSPKRTFTGGTDAMWKPLPAVNWKPLVEGNSLNFLSDPFTTPTAFAGWGSADIWLRSTEVDTDLEVTLTEVRPDGKETFIQAGWLRASRRKIDTANSTDLLPVHSHLAADAQPLVPGEWTLARVELFPFAHVLRPGSQLRVNIEVPGGDQAFWEVDPLNPGRPVTNGVAHSVGRASKIVLPLVPAGITPPVPAARPACPGLRGQACRDYLPARIATNVAAVINGTALKVTWNPPPGGAVPDSYTVTAQPTGETFTVPGTSTAFTYPNAIFGTAYSFTVAAQFGVVAAPASNASLSVTIQAPTTTTTSTTSTSTSTSTTTSTTPAVGANGATSPPINLAAASPATVTGTLPTTGSAIEPFLLAAGALVLTGAAVLALSRRRRTTPPNRFGRR